VALVDLDHHAVGHLGAAGPEPVEAGGEVAHRGSISDVQRVSVPARAGLAGNPSDAYGGAALAVPVPSLAAAVEIHDAETLHIAGPPDGSRLIRAAVDRLMRHAARDDAFEVRWSTTIPREVGLAGSSALIVATLQAVCVRWSLALEPLELARMALAVEVEDLGIAAGLMDRAVQAFGAPVLVDGGNATPLQPVELPPMVVAWSTAAAAPSHSVHGPLRARFEAGEGDVVAAMTRLAAIGRDAAAALERGDRDGLVRGVRATYTERVRLGIVGPAVATMVEALESIGAAATSTGSGGAVVGVLPQQASDADARAALEHHADGVVVVSGPAASRSP
jgi:glucuronokinase